MENVVLILSLVFFFLSAWIALYYLVIRPKLVSFRYTAGIYAKLDAWEAGFWAKAWLWLKGIKVAIIGFVTSSAPLLAVFYDKIAGLDWSQFLPSERAKIIAGCVTVLGIVGPMVMVWLHQGAIADASASSPVQTPPPGAK